MTVSPEQFAEFFHALHGYPPFRWQQRLVELVATGDWPQALALPTASGKTACLDIALFALACQADLPPEERTAPRRIFFVVDRRIIVDEAHTRAAKIGLKLAHASDGVLCAVAERLRKVAGDEHAKPLVYGELRGGIYRDNTWAKTPTQPTVICSTVDQIGSRLLFRGYGLGPATRVVHAGLVANDALIILDEAHCAKPFYQTAQAIRRYREWCDPQHRLATPFQFVVMSATPPVEIPDNAVFPGRDVWMNDLAQPDQWVLRKRIEASKPASLVVAPREPAKSNEKLAATLIAQAVALVDDQHRRIGIIVNRVATARRVYEQLGKKHDAVLLTGRMRGIDRDKLLADWRPSGADVSSATPANADCSGDTREVSGLLKWFGVESDTLLDHPVFVIATQCLEVGANLDFDVLVTECASLDALRQRFGRLNRAGRDIQARSAIVIRGDQVEPKDEDPVYGASLAATWKWLAEKAVDSAIDFGISGFESLLPPLGDERSRLLDALQMPTVDAPVMLPAHVDCWVQTAPVPAPDPDPAMFLHGPNHGSPEVHVCWRADLSEGDDESAWIDALSLCPPSTSECLSVPLYLIRGWLRDQGVSAGMLTDVETTSEPDEDDGEEARLPATLLWHGVEDSRRLRSARDLRDLRPGDTLVLPVEPTRKEWQLFGHIPPQQDGTTIVDRGDEANFQARGKATLRLHPALLADWPPCAERDSLVELIDSEDVTDRAAELQELLVVMLDRKLVPERLERLVECLVKRRPKVFVHPCRTPSADGKASWTGVILVGPRQFKRQFDLDADDELHETFVNDDNSSLTSHEIELTEHLQGVAEFARRFASDGGLAGGLVNDFMLAGRCHDLGKLDERFQAWLRGGSRLQARLASLKLAKSEGLTNLAEIERARRRSGYPRAGRHELASMRLLEQAETVLARCEDPDLVLHLIAAHHGHCRPFAPVIDDAAPVTVTADIEDHIATVSSATGLERLDSGVADRFWRLVRRYGWWGLAWLEAIFILADHRRSEAEQAEAEHRTKDMQKGNREHPTKETVL
jgi:CRISPR-associated endonuclease/helicase Cas3